ncbi:MAG: phosphoglycerate mutase [Rhizorhabdus sp.]|nr:phosphoglycerate mutase [Rhizorhabdus sp.]
MTRRVLLVRHTAVALRWKGICYGSSDAGLSRAGHEEARQLARTLAREPITALIHSGQRRARLLAEMIGISARPDPRWRERDFGSWEGRSWHAIWRETGNLMDGMLTDPHAFRPGGGETGAELATRVAEAWAELPRDGTIAVISHGGPIATARLLAAGRPLTEAIDFVPATGTIVEL